MEELNNTTFSRPSLLMGTENSLGRRYTKSKKSILQNKSTIDSNENIINIINKSSNSHKSHFSTSPTQNSMYKMNVLNVPRYARESHIPDFSKEDFDFKKDESSITLGFFGGCFRAKNKKNGVFYAIKILNKEKAVRNGKVSLLNLQIENMYKVNHPLFIRLLSHFEDVENLYLVFQYCENNTLLDKIKNKSLNKDNLNKYFKQIITALSYLHSKKIYCLSLEPETIMIDEDDNIRLTDYGFSKITKSDMNRRRGFRTDNNCFVNAYVAPELIFTFFDKTEIHRSGGNALCDLWQVGVLIYEALTGHLPFEECTSRDSLVKTLKSEEIVEERSLDQLSKIPDEYSFYKESILDLIEPKPNLRKSLKSMLSNEILSNIKDTFDYKKDLNFQYDSYDNKGEYTNSPHKNNSNYSIFQEKNDKFDMILRENEELKNELRNLKEELEDVIKEKKVLERRNKQLEEIINEDNSTMSDEIVELKSQIRTLEFDIDLKQMSIEEEKEKFKNLEEKYNHTREEYEQIKYLKFESDSQFQSKIEDLESRLFNQAKPGNQGKDYLEYYIALFSENIKGFNEAISQFSSLSFSAAEGAQKVICEIIEEKSKKFEKMIENIKERFNSSSLTLKSHFEDKTMNEKMDWFKSQMTELIPFKHKCASQTETINKLKQDLVIMKQKLELTQTESKTLKDNKEMIEEKLKKTEENLKKMQNKLCDIDDFISQNCPDLCENLQAIYNITT